MSFRKTVSLGILAWVALGTVAVADPIKAVSGSGAWTFWSQASGSVVGTPTYARSFEPAPVPKPVGAAPTIPVPVISPVTPAPSYSAPVSTPSISSSSAQPDAYLNFGTGIYAGAPLMTSGTIQPWYESPAVTKVFGGVPTPQQQSDFANTVMKNVEQTFLNSGINVNLTLDPNAQVAHTVSVVSGASYAQNPNAIGISEIGGNGFSFIDKLNYAQTVDQLEWADAHNIAHELMHAFGVATHHDQTGTYLDAAAANWDMLTSPNTKFSPEATADILARLARNHSNPALAMGAEMLGLSSLPPNLSCHCLLCQQGYVLTGPTAQEVGAAPVPEPSTMVLWASGALASVFALRRQRGGNVETPTATLPNSNPEPRIG
ncbi:PEP-CTERM sorting domain-containing protein [Singulisphaera acidiphila]|uniref:PEP-CTERM motif protein n=1 Tax=Singulisphaera acidiphila (strain ATCC BAA-1392 / DSM 18658 / VKM B-2454 / MOB10) TaxID=886293 RepID=L0DAR4_SINAD|nr:PEP-CTERM sorting domain-containing protein [Singulisphaera acidiphila]AGA26464.1 PEP-CTERM motif protein [Singulisphaera acidiphila DSM 18658]